MLVFHNGIFVFIMQFVFDRTPIKFKVCVLAHLVCCSYNLSAQSALPEVSSGKVIRLENFTSNYVTPRHVDVWLPEGYSEKEKYAVLYMQDGANLFDPEMTWNKQSWNMDETATELMKRNDVRKFIVVAIWISGKERYLDYYPEKPFLQLSQEEKDTVSARLHRAGRTERIFIPKSDNYLKFLVEELKPYIDEHFAVCRNHRNTFIGGSSSGALLSWYALCEYPRVFGGAACLSTHWPGMFTSVGNPMPDAFIKYLHENLPKPVRTKIYFDCGDQTLDSLYGPMQQRIDSLMKAHHFDDKNWRTQYFPGHDHSENAWSERLHFPLLFFYEKRVSHKAK